MTSEPTIRQRCHRIAHVLSWCGQGDPQETLIDLLADAMHWCDANGETFSYVLAVAGKHYINELNE